MPGESAQGTQRRGERTGSGWILQVCERYAAAGPPCRQSKFSPSQYLPEFVHDDTGENDHPSQNPEGNKQGQEMDKNEKVPRTETTAENEKVAGNQAPVDWLVELVTSVRVANIWMMKFGRKIEKWMNRKKTRLQRIELKIHYVVTQINNSVNDEFYQSAMDDEDEFEDRQNIWMKRRLVDIWNYGQRLSTNNHE
ncbi:hypothetical protein ACH5RR_003785 [Cinchona calisaya]|uniref:Uncharacterized protein n=1 Tax=Cinchona calisaya TaxID=153742 RepID=A0ABD3AWF8_9GENT